MELRDQILGNNSSSFLKGLVAVSRKIEILVRVRHRGIRKFPKMLEEIFEFSISQK